MARHDDNNGDNMKKAFLGMAMLAALTAQAQAQSNVTLYGIVDAGLVRETGGPAGAVTNVSSGVASGSRIGFKGREDLGGGLSAIFQFENGFNADTGAAGQGGLLFGRQAFVGLSGRLGTLTLGRQYTPFYKTLRDIGDPFGAVSLAGRAGNLFATNSRTDNTVEYASPKFGGVRVDLTVGAGETAGDSSRNRTLGGSVGYYGTALTIQLAHYRAENATGSGHGRNSLLSANYKFGRVTAYGAFAANSGPATADSRDALAGVAVEAGPGKVLLSHVRHDDKGSADHDASQWGIGYLHPLSRRTDIYIAYAAIDNRNGAAFKVGNATDRGTGDRAFNLGVRHNF
jgi:predicted porin